MADGTVYWNGIAITPNRREVLVNLYGEAPNGISPMWFGGSNGSHHSSTAAGLCKTTPQLVERRFRGGEWGGKRHWAARGSCVYRLTDAGEEATESIVDPKHIPGMRARKVAKWAEMVAANA